MSNCTRWSWNPRIIWFSCMYCAPVTGFWRTMSSTIARRLYGQPGERKTLLDQHLALIKAIIAGDAEAARRASQAHIDHVSLASQHLTAADAREETSKLRRTIRLANAG
jgi:DNA-binding GntR family transcriptional regulator